MICPKCHTENPVDSKFCKECATSLTPSEQPQISLTKTLEMPGDELTRGTLFAGRYEIIEELGAGGMGKVYRAFDKKLQEEIALKLIRPEIGVDKRTVERFHNEIKVARKISHKNVCRVHDLGEAEKNLFITMEYVRGEDLKSLIHRTKTLSVGTAISIAGQVAEGLGEAHRLGIVHRDLKPGNIMIDKEGNAKIMDFGIARTLAAAGTTVAGAIIGTPEYMSPEQVDGKEADRRSDIYALGVILFEMIIGRAPFEGDTPFSIANKHKSEPPPIPKKLVPQIPDGLNKLILRCLEKEKAKRYQTAEELVADLTAVEEALPKGERIVAKPKITNARTVTVKFQPRKLIIPIAAILILAVAGYVLWRNVIRTAAPPPSAKAAIAVLSFRNNSGDPALDIWKENLPTLLAGGLGQSRYLRLVDDPTVYGILKKLNLLNAEKYTPEELKTIGTEGRATHLISGNYLDAGGKFIVNLSLIDAKTGTVLAPIQAEAPNREAIFNSVDSLVKKVKSALNIPEQAIDERDYKMVGDVYTRNPKAFQSYIEGTKLRLAGDYGKAIAPLEKAVELDPGFAMAYRMLGICYSGVGDEVKGYQYLHKAYELRGKLPEKDRLLVEGSWYTLREDTFPKAVAAFKKVIARYPEDFQGPYSLAMIEDKDGSIRELEYLLRSQNQTESWLVYLNLAHGYCLTGDYKKARERFEEWVNAHPQAPREHVLLAWLFQLEKNLDAAAKEYEKAISLAPQDPRIRALVVNIDLTNGNPDKALQTLDDIIKTQKDPLIFDGDNDWMMALFMIKGKFKETLALGEKADKKALIEGPTNVLLADLSTRRGKELLQTGYAEKALEKFRQGREYIKKEEDRIPETRLNNLMHEERTMMMWEVCALCDMGRVEEAEALYKQLESLIPKYIKRLQTVCICMTTAFPAGKIALAKKDSPAAVKMLEEGLQKMFREDFTFSSDHAYLLDVLGDAYRLGNRLDKSAETYARIRELQNGRWEWGAVYSRSFYKLGKVYEQMGKKDEARKEYSKFLDLWKDADPGQPEVEDARKRLAGL